MTSATDPSPQDRVRSLYEQLLSSWNCGDANGFAALFAEDGELVGGDGSQLAGREEIAASLRHLFADQGPAAYVALVRSVRFPAPEVALLRAEAGMIPPGHGDIDPAASAVHVMVAVRQAGGWRVAAFQNTPARFPGRPELAAALAAELRQQLGRAGQG